MKKLIPILFFVANTYANTLLPFETDGCTYFFDGTINQPKLWQHCCFIHDIKYWIGGDKNDQNRADLNLKNCVEEVAGTEWANLIYRGVKLGHYSPIKNVHNWSWGFGDQKNRYEKLAPEELIFARESILKLDFPNEIINRTIEEYFIFN